jgi:hypothetical protein
MEWAAAAILAVVYLAWFGNHTAEKYRRLYGKLPEIQPAPPRRNVYRHPPEDLETAMTCAGSYAVSSMSFTAMPVSRPGSIIRLDKWD